jgi:hypothetical protein
MQCVPLDLWLRKSLEFRLECMACPSGTTSDSDVNFPHYCITAVPCAAGSYLAVDTIAKTRLCQTCAAGKVSQTACMLHAACNYITYVVVLYASGDSRCS